MEDHGQSMEETYDGVSGCLKESCEPLGNPHKSRQLAGTCRLMEGWAHSGSGFLVGIVAFWATHSGAGYAWSSAGWEKLTEIGAVFGEPFLVGRTHIEEVCAELSPKGRIPHWSRGRIPLPEQQQKQCDELTVTPISCLPELEEGQEGPEKDQAVGGKCSQDLFYFTLSCSGFVKFNWLSLINIPSWVCFVCVSN